MLITNVHLSRIRVPLRQPFISANGIRNNYQKTIIRFDSKDGITGFGETDGSDEVFTRVCRISENILNGEGPFNNESISPLTFAHFRNSPLPDRVAVGGIEMAFWDIEGKRHGQPVNMLLGGSHRSSVSMVCELSAGPFTSDQDSNSIEAFFTDLNNVERVVQAGVDEIERGGYQILKQKCTGRSAEWDVRVMKGLRKALGADFNLRHDPNGAYTASEAISLCRNLDDLELQWFEDPTSGIDAMGDVRSEVRTPLATNMCVTNFDQLDYAIKKRALDVIGIDPFHWAGLANAKEAISICRANGLDIFCHHFLDLGITTSAMLHLSSSIPDLPNGMDTSLYLQGTDIICGGEFQVKNGRIEVPIKPGLGVTVDESMVRRFTIEEFKSSR